MIIATILRGLATHGECSCDIACWISGVGCCEKRGNMILLNCAASTAKARTDRAVGTVSEVLRVEGTSGTIVQRLAKVGVDEVV